MSGANLRIDPDSVTIRWNELWSCKVLLLQNELPEAVNLASARAAKERGALVILNAAPARVTDAALLELVDVLVVNRVEAAMMSGCGDDLGAALEKLRGRDRDVVVTRGGDDILLATRAGLSEVVPVLPVRVISSHGAGDCFCGALAARMAAGEDISRASRYAIIAAGLFVSFPEAEQARLGDRDVSKRLRS